MISGGILDYLWNCWWIPDGIVEGLLIELTNLMRYGNHKVQGIVQDENVNGIRSYTLDSYGYLDSQGHWSSHETK